MKNQLNAELAPELLTSLDSPLRIAAINIAGGRLGMTICPGKKSKTSISGHGWARDLAMDIADSQHRC